jgi:4-hydroxy-3-methylbut-2-enyl diphosphate reductase
LEQEFNRPAFLVDGPDDLKEADFQNFGTILITAGASAPELVVQNTLQWLKDHFNATVEEQEVRKEEVYFPLPKVLRQIAMKS